MAKHQKIPSFFKWAFILFMAVLIPSYWINYGPTNFLWFSDIILFLVFFAVIFESKFLASMAAVGGIIHSLLWNIDFFWVLIARIFGSQMTGFLTAYMFDVELPIWLRILSSFHILFPFLLLWLIYRLGYHARAWIFQVLLSWIVLLFSWLFTEPAKNINLVFSYQILNMSAPFYLILESIAIFIVIIITHFLFKYLFKSYK